MNRQEEDDENRVEVLFDGRPRQAQGMHHRLESRETFDDESLIEAEARQYFRRFNENDKSGDPNKIESIDGSMEALNGGGLRISGSDAGLLDLAHIQRAQEIRARGTDEASQPSSRHHSGQRRKHANQ